MYAVRKSPAEFLSVLYYLLSYETIIAWLNYSSSVKKYDNSDL